MPAFRMPAEWEPQAATWLAWPHNAEDWPGKFEPIPWVFAEFIRLIADVQRVRLLVKDEATQIEAEEFLSRAHVKLENVDFYRIPTDRGWMRDCGPIFVYDNGQKKMLDWKFTGWAKYDNHLVDDVVPQAVQAANGLARITPQLRGKPVVLEGGAIDVNGKGTLITTEECLLSTDIQCRNPGFTREDYEAVFAEYLGISQVIWLSHGIVGDDTHGHVDDITRFVNADTIVTVTEKNLGDDNHASLIENLKRLKSARDANGKQFTIAELPMPKPLYFENTRLPASYANFLILNNRVLVPTFNDCNDRVALNILAELMPDREIIGIHAVDLVWGFGTLHCLSQQEPA